MSAAAYCADNYVSPLPSGAPRRHVIYFFVLIMNINSFSSNVQLCAERAVLKGRLPNPPSPPPKKLNKYKKKTIQNLFVFLFVYFIAFTLKHAADTGFQGRWKFIKCRCLYCMTFSELSSKLRGRLHEYGMQ